MSLSEIKQQFKSPDPKFGPVPAWWWSAEEVTAERVRWQMEKFRNGGLRNILIINLAPMGPAFGSESDRPAYMSDQWWELFELTLREAERLGMHLWFYDQIGFSGANLPARIVAQNPEYAGYQLYRFLHTEELPQNADIILETEEHKYVVVRQGFNWLDKEASAAIIDRVHGEFERRFPHDLGETIAGSFQDEHPGLPIWTPQLEAVYQERFKEELIPQLPKLFDPLPGAEDLRRRVYRLAAEMGEEAFFKPLGEWHNKHGMLIGFDQAGPSRRGDPNAAQRFYLDYFRTHRSLNAPGNDMDGETKPHSSMAHMHGGKRVWIEAFHSSGWGGTIEETMHWLLPWFQAGATLYNPHAVYYSTRGGWWEWAPPDTGWRQPYFEHYPQFADTIARICYLLSRGSHVCDIAVHYPSYAVAGHQSLNDGKRYEHTMRLANRDPNETVTHIRNVYWQLVGQWHRRKQLFDGVLKQNHRDFDIVDDTALEKAVPQGEKLAIADEAFSVLLLCGTTEMDAEARKKVEAWIKQGGWVIGVDIPEDDPVIEGIVHVKSAEDAAELIEGRIPKQVDGPGPSLHRRTDDADIFLLLPGKDGLLEIPAAASPETKVPESAVYHLRTEGIPELWDPVTGETAPLNYVRRGNLVSVEVPFTQWPAALVVCSFGQEAEKQQTDTADSLETAVNETWQHEQEVSDWIVKAVPTLDNRYGDFDLHDPETSLMQIDRRHVQVNTEMTADEGETAGWHEPSFDDTAWNTSLWSEAQYWLLSDGETFDENNARPVVYSNVFGNLEVRDWEGRMGRVPRRFLDFGKVPEGKWHTAKTHVIAPRDGSYWLRLESNAEFKCVINGNEVKWPEKGERSAWVELMEGVNEVLLKAQGVRKSKPIRTAFAIYEQELSPLPAWIRVEKPNAKSLVRQTVVTNNIDDIKQVRLIFAAKGRAQLVVNGKKITEHGDFHPVVRFGQEQVDVTSLWKSGDNVIECLLPEGDGSVLVDGLIENRSGEVEYFYSGESWKDEENGPVLIDRYEQSENLWISARPHPLPKVGWLMPEAEPKPAPLPLVCDPKTIGKPVWIRFPLPVGAKSMTIRAAGDVRVWIDGKEVPINDQTAAFEPQKAGTIAAIRVVPKQTETGAAVLTAPIRFETAAVPGELGDWRTALSLAHHSGVVEYETTLELTEDLSDAVLDLGHVRGTAEVWLDGISRNVRLWRPYRYSLGHVSKGVHRLRIRVTNTLGTHYEIGRPTTMVGFHPIYTTAGRPEEPEWLKLYPSGGLFGPVQMKYNKA